MIYKFKSQATADLIMLGADGDHLLRLLGHEVAARGIIEVAAMPGAIATLEAAMAADMQTDGAPEATNADADADARQSDADTQRSVALRQRLWPMVEMLREAHAGNKPIVWGV